MPIPFPINKLIHFLLRLYNRNNEGLQLKRPEENNVLGENNFYDLKFIDIKGNNIFFNAFKGKKVLLVNTASACGYTQQYAQLEKLYKQFNEKLIIIAFPSNDFGKQEQGNNETINLFCNKIYHITFFLSQKIKVKGQNQHPVYQWLCNAKFNGWNNQEPTWNFCKYLVNENGELQYFFSEKTEPSGKTIKEAIENNLQ